MSPYNNLGAPDEFETRGLWELRNRGTLGLKETSVGMNYGRVFRKTGSKMETFALGLAVGLCSSRFSIFKLSQSLSRVINKAFRDFSSL